MSKSSLNKVTYTRGVPVDLSDDEITMIEANPYSSVDDGGYDYGDDSSSIIADDGKNSSARRKRFFDASKRYVPSNGSFVRLGKIMLLLCVVIIVTYIVVRVKKSTEKKLDPGAGSDVKIVDDKLNNDEDGRINVVRENERSDWKSEANISSNVDNSVSRNGTREFSDRYENSRENLANRRTSVARPKDNVSETRREDKGGLLIKIPIPTDPSVDYTTKSENDIDRAGESRPEESNATNNVVSDKNSNVTDANRSIVKSFKTSLAERKATRLEKISRDSDRSVYTENIDFIDLVYFIIDQEFLLETLSCKNIRATIKSRKNSAEASSSTSDNDSVQRSSYYVPIAERNKQILKLTRRFWLRYSATIERAQGEASIEATDADIVSSTTSKGGGDKNGTVTIHSDKESLLSLARPLLINLFDRTELLEMQMFASIVAVALESNYANDIRFILNNIDPILIVSRIRALRDEISKLRVEMKARTSNLENNNNNGQDRNNVTTSDDIAASSANDRREIVDDPSGVLLPESKGAVAKCYAPTLLVGRNMPKYTGSLYRATEQNSTKWIPVLPAMRYRGKTLARVATSNGTCYDLPKDEYIKDLKTFDSTAVNNVSMGIGYVNHELIATFGTSVFLIDGTRISTFASFPENIQMPIYRIPSFVKCLNIRGMPDIQDKDKKVYMNDFKINILLPNQRLMYASVTVYSSMFVDEKSVSVDDNGLINVSIRAGEKVTTVSRIYYVDSLRDKVESWWMFIVPYNFDSMDNIGFSIDSMKLSIRMNATSVEYGTIDK